MAQFTLDKQYILGIKHVDEQHAKLVDLMDEVRSAMSTGKGRQVIATVLHSLIEYTRTHFVDEEAIMKDSGYPHLAYHQSLHEKFVERVVKYTRDYLEGRSVPVNAVREMLYDWLMEHIKEEDRRFAEYMKSKAQ